MKATGILAILAMCIMMVFTSCEKEDSVEPNVIPIEDTIVQAVSHKYEYKMKVYDYTSNQPVDINVEYIDSSSVAQVVKYTDYFIPTEHLVYRWRSTSIPPTMLAIRVTAAQIYNRNIFVSGAIYIDGVVVAHSAGVITGSGEGWDQFSLGYITGGK